MHIFLQSCCDKWPPHYELPFLHLYLGEEYLELELRMGN